MTSVTNGYYLHKAFFFKQWTHLMNWGYHLFIVICNCMNNCSYCLRIIYIWWRLMWEIEYAVGCACTSLKIISVPVPIVLPFSYRACMSYALYKPCLYVNSLYSFCLSVRKSVNHCDIFTRPLWTVYREIQEERSVFLEVIISVIVRKNVHINMHIIVNGYRTGALLI
jgi:hypothetical protein